MMQFVFRNNTIERFFPKEYFFSGYDDISHIPSEAEGYVWFYQVPVRYELGMLTEEIEDCVQKLNLVLLQIDSAKTVIALTMEQFYHVSFTGDDHQVRLAIDNYNKALFALSTNHQNLKVIDFSEFTRQYAVRELMDWKFWFISQMGINPKLAKPFMEWWSRKLEEISLKRKKCLVLDLDNTLWGGVLGEDDIEGLKLGGDYPGKAFLYFQEALLELSKSGVILTVCSKNNEEDVLKAWEKNPFMVLKKEHFATWRINWTDKATNIKALAEELNIGLDSMVFVDDNPAERELIRQMLPMVEVPEFPAQPYELPAFFKEIVDKYFRVYSVTSEDKKKTEQYKANAQRAQQRQSYGDLTEFLRSLDIQMTIETANEFNIPRIAQMTQKTNQFNLTTKRYTDADIRQFLQEGWRIWCLSVADKFGDSGITGCIIVKGNVIDTFLLSCRILGKGIEHAFLKRVLHQLRSEGFDSIKASFLPTLKNGQVADFFDKNGFSVLSEETDGTKRYNISLADANLETEEYYHIIIK